MITNPYRSSLETLSAVPAHGCIVCRARAALAHVNWWRVTGGVIAGILPLVCVGSASVAYASVAMNARMAAAAEVLAAVAAKTERMPKVPPVTRAPAAPSPAPAAVSVCTSVEREVYRDVLVAALREGLPGPRIVPESANGKVVGLRLFGIRDGSGLSRLGLVNGDLVLSVNGAEIGTPEKALETYARVETAEDIVVELARKGVPRELRFHVRPGGTHDSEHAKLEAKASKPSAPF